MNRMSCCGTLLACMVATANADQQTTTFGLGAGALYNGLGVNLGRVTGHDLRYLALGCVSVAYSSRHGLDADCGLGLGWMRSGPFSSSHRHALGLHLGVTYDTHAERSAVEPFLGVPYVYFSHGMAAAGWNLGVTPTLGRHDDNLSVGLMLNAGFQFF